MPFSSGGDIAIHYHPHIAHWLHLESNFSLLSTQDISGRPLPQIPQNRLNNIIKVDFKSEKIIKNKQFVCTVCLLFRTRQNSF